MGCCETHQKREPLSKGNPYNPIQQIIDEFSIERLRQKWDRKELQVIENKVKSIPDSYIKFSTFLDLFPRIRGFSEKTQKGYYSLLAYEDNKEGGKNVMTHKELIVSLTIIRKVTNNRDFAPLLFYVYTSQQKHEKMYQREIEKFLKENKDFKKNAAQDEEIEGEIQQQVYRTQQYDKDGAKEKEKVANTPRQQVVHDSPRKQREKSASNIKQSKTSKSSSKNSSQKQLGPPVSKPQHPVQSRRGTRIVGQDGQRKSQGKIVKHGLSKFCVYFNHYNLKLYQAFFNWNIEQEEKQLTFQLSKNEPVNNKGDLVYLLEYRWYLEWRAYASWFYKTAIKHERRMSHSVVTKRRSLPSTEATDKEPSRPGPIKNTLLFDDTNTYDLARNLVENINYICVKEEIWSKLLAIYSGGPSVQRIYPKIYDNAVVKVKVDKQGYFLPGSQKRNSSDKKYIRDYGNRKEMDYACFYRYPGKNKWVRLLKLNRLPSQEIFNVSRTYLVFVPQTLVETFENRYNPQKEKGGGEIVKERFRNYGSEIKIAVEGVMVRGEVVNVGKNEIEVEYMNETRNAIKATVHVNDKLKMMNPQNLLTKTQYNELSGLTNIGNTCYLNAVLQCVIRTPAFGRYLESQNFEKNKEGKDPLLLTEIANIHRASKQIEETGIDMRPFKALFDKYCPFFEGNAQHDAQEFLISLLARISEEIQLQRKEYGVKAEKKQVSKSNLNKTNEKVVKFFSGKTEAITRCSKCGNEGKRVQPFFTYSLSLPEVRQMEFTYYVVHKLKGSRPSTPVRYGIQLTRKTTIDQFIDAVCRSHKIPSERMILYEIYHHEILNVLDRTTYQKELAHHMNFNIKLVFYEVENSKNVSYAQFKNKNYKNASIKLEVQQRVYSNKSKKYKLVYLPYLVEVTEKTTWKDVLSQIESFTGRLTEKPKGSEIAVEDNNEHDKMNETDAKNEPSSNKHKIRVIKSKTGLENICQFCKDPFILTSSSKSTQKCKGCGFEEEKPLFEQKEFRNYHDLILLAVDWDSPSPKWEECVDDPSYLECNRITTARKDKLTELLDRNFKNEEEIELSCEAKTCKSKTATRLERITVPPNILLLHLKRFSFEDNMLVKLTNNVEYGPRLRLPNSEEEYELYGVIVHFGSGVGGHYIAYVRVRNNWYRCDDAQVSLCRPGEEFDPNAYILFYKKVNFEPSLMSMIF